MISNTLYYLVYTSAILIYGVGLNRLTLICQHPYHVGLNCIKMLITVSSTSVLTYLFTKRLLTPYSLTELYPFIAVIIFTFISVFIESIIRITTGINSSEFCLSMLFILLSVNECVNLLECLLNSVVCVCAFYISIPFLYCVRKRIEVSRSVKDFENSSLLFISVAIFMILLLSWNVSWLNGGVFH